MSELNYARCMECNEEGMFPDGSTCARCLGLGYLPIEELEEKLELVSLEEESEPEMALTR